ncbi:hypothetical protein BZA77DRAFT_315733 [Pyronema omphalodes]|nr:hypothetical protein BZA77DRAFT_315733 [Pyronema omphalodes]
MGRRKIEIKPIKDDRNRSVTFLKRKGGLFKKAHELSVLCSVDVAVVIFSSNKKLYQYCSGDINEMISRHSYYESPHESKGPNDFFGKKDLGDDDDDDDIMPGPERADSHSSNDHPMPHHMQHPPPHLSNRQQTASASPPNLPKTLVGPGGFGMPRVGTPQPMTRPSSRNQVQRRNSSNLVPPNGYPATQPPSHQTNGYGYMHQQQHPQHAQHHPQHPQPPPQHIQHQPQPVYGSQIMPPSGLAQVQYPSYSAPQLPHQTPAQAQAEAYINDSRRQSMPPVTYAEPAAPPPVSPPRTSPPVAGLEPKRAPAKSRSMFTPIGPSESMLAAHFGFGGTTERPRPKPASPPQTIKEEKITPAPLPPIPISTSPPPPSRSNSMADPKSAGMRPKLKVCIPSGNSDAGSPSSSSPRENSGNAGNISARPTSDNPVVLPPPSPSHSVGTLLSAGATGPSNPFSRPPPQNNQPEQTPMSALPSHFTESMLASPSGFYGSADWLGPLPPFTRRGGGDMLPSPLNFQTPVGQGSFFGRGKEEEQGTKRRSPGTEESEGGGKRQKS